MNLADRKAEARSLARQNRKASHQAGGMTASFNIVARGLSAIGDAVSLATPGVVGGYLAVGSELDAGPLMAVLERQGWTLALPVVVAPDTPLVFRQWQSGDPMTEGAFGIQEPVPAAAELIPDFVLAPLLAFDNDGYRLGQGGGFYDRTLDKWRAAGHLLPVLGLAFDDQQIDAVPRDKHDQRLDGIITPGGWRKFGDD